MTSFFNSYKKEASKVKGIQHSAPGPKFWISTGNYIINKIISGRYLNGIGQGKFCMLAGPSGAGKSFLVGNLIKSAQSQGYCVYVIDSEHALDDSYLNAIGVDTENDFIYSGVSTITQMVSVLSSFLKAYRANGSEDKILIVIDSLDAMLTDSDKNVYDKGETHGDMGQKVRQIKAALQPVTHDIKDLNVAVVCTKQVYKSQKTGADRSPITEWNITETLLYAFSQVLLVTRLMVKDEKNKSMDGTAAYDGIMLKVFGAKTRFTKPFQRAAIAVPYATGMDPFSGILEVAVSMKLITRPSGSSWYTYKDTKFQSGDFYKVQDDVLADLVAMDDRIALDVDTDALEEGADSLNDEVHDTATIAKSKKTKK